MKDLKHFEQMGRRGFYRPNATVTFEQAVNMCAEAMQHARALNLTDLLCSTLTLTGFIPPDIFARYEMVNRWVASAGASLSVALVCRPEIIDPQKIGVVMAQNRGVSANVFTTEAAAIAWLDGRPGAIKTNT